MISGVLGHRKNFGKNQTEINFLIFIENRNLDLKFDFQFDNEKEKGKKLKIQFHFKTKIECPFRPTDCTRFINPCAETAIQNVKI